jgi:ABC-type transporter Mla maintaining outer membrane lipid asymmetry ATPase subunit MlaF
VRLQGLEMKTAIHFQDAVKTVRGLPIFRINDLRVFEKEALGIYGLPEEYIEILVNQLTGAFCSEEGSVTILGTDSREVEGESWFQFLENFGIYNPYHLFEEGASIGENVAALYRLRNESMEEPHLSASVLRLANLVQLTITDLSKMMGEASPLLRMKTRLARALAYHPGVVVLCNPVEDLSFELTQHFTDLIRRTRRKMKYTLVALTSNVWFLEQIVDRVVFLNPLEGTFVENRLRGWYHKLLPFLKPSPSELLQLSRNV